MHTHRRTPLTTRRSPPPQRATPKRTNTALQTLLVALTVTVGTFAADAVFDAEIVAVSVFVFVFVCKAVFGWWAGEG